MSRRVMLSENFTCVLPGVIDFTALELFLIFGIEALLKS